MGKFVINKTKNGEFQFNLKAGNSQVIITSETYKTKKACENGIESTRKNSADDKKFERKKAKNGKPYFVLKATNGQVIGKSEMYQRNESCEKGIASVAKNAPKAPVEDLS
jgi:uncharacterized protein